MEEREGRKKRAGFEGESRAWLGPRNQLRAPKQPPTFARGFGQGSHTGALGKSERDMTFE